jgi:hypothetical protein
VEDLLAPRPSGAVARYPNLTSGIAAAIFIIVSFNRVQS